MSRHLELHIAAAVLTEDATPDWFPASTEISDQSVWAKVRWTAADGSAHMGQPGQG
jgi:hypothetical protein